MSRYAHRNPVETKIPSVRRLEDYQYSSYPAYIGQSELPHWLGVALTKQLLGHKGSIGAYRQFVMQGSDEATIAFHQTGNTGAVFGSDNFKSWVFDELLPELAVEQKDRVIRPNLLVQTICLTVAQFYRVDLKVLCQSSRGSQCENEPRKVAMYFCQHSTGATLREVAECFNHQHYRSASYATNQVKQRKLTDKNFGLKLQAISKILLDCWKEVHFKKEVGDQENDTCPPLFSVSL